MSEHLNRHEDSHEPDAAAEFHEQSTEHPERHEAVAEKTEAVNPVEVRKDLERITHDKDENEDEASKKLHAVAPAVDLPPPSKAIKNVTRNNNLNRIRDNLPASSRSFSKFIHNPTVNTINEVAAKTIVRPYAILLGAIFACVGSSFYIYYLRHTGYKYNFFVPLLLFIGGFIIALIAEVIFKVSSRRKRT